MRDPAAFFSEQSLVRFIDAKNVAGNIKNVKKRKKRGKNKKTFKNVE